MSKKSHSKNKIVKKAQTFVYKAPAANAVLLLGDFTKWQERPIPLSKNGDGTWHTTIEMEPGQHHYRFLVDGQWQEDPECQLHAPNPYGGSNSVCQIVAE